MTKKRHKPEEVVANRLSYAALVVEKKVIMTKEEKQPPSPEQKQL